MKIFRSAGLYALANAVIALIGLILTILLGKMLGTSGFGELASFFALQNIWASLGFLRIETRLASSKSNIEANKIILAGFFIGFFISLIMTILTAIILGLDNQGYLMFPAGYALTIFDTLALRQAYSGKKRDIILIRTARIVWPLSVAFGLATFEYDVQQIVFWQTWTTVTLAFLVWQRWIHLNRWFFLSKATMVRYRKGLVPSIFLCILNGIWISGMIPFLNTYVDPSLAGQFAMLQRIVGGSLGLVSTAISIVFSGRDFVDVKWLIVQKVLLTNILLSILVCLILAIPFILMPKNILGNEWIFEDSLYWSTSLFSIISFSIGAISIIAVRLQDEWFLTAWQALALFTWIIIYLILPNKLFIVTALNFGALLYIILAFRWRHLALRKKYD